MSHGKQRIVNSNSLTNGEAEGNREGPLSILQRHLI